MPDGNLIKGYSYDEFGNTQQNGTSSFLNEVTFTGSVSDKSTGLQYMNARYYDPNNGRFLSQDSYSGNAYDPWTQHLYSYCGNNPTNMVDPTGHNGEWVQWINFAQRLKETASTLWAADGPLPILDVASAVLLVVGGASWLGGKIGEAIDSSKPKTSAEHAKPGPRPASSKTYEKTTIQDVIDGTFDKPWLKDRSMSDRVAEAIDKAKATPFVDTKTDTKNKKMPNESYWPADLIGRTVVVQWQLPLDYNAAKNRVDNSDHIMCRSLEAARIVANSFAHPVGPEISGGGQSGFFPHYHPSRSSKTHIWFIPIE